MNATSETRLLGPLAWFAAAFRVLTGVGAIMTRAASRAVPKRRDRWVFGTRGDRYDDNPMYLYEHVVQHHRDLDAVWISGDPLLVRQLRQAGRTARLRWSPAGIWTLLTAAANVYASDPADTSFAFTGGSVTTNLYHGLPLKQIEFGSHAPVARRVYHPVGVLDRLRSHTIYAPKWVFQDVIATSTDWAESVFRASYDGRVGTAVLGAAPRVAWALKANAEPATPPPHLRAVTPATLDALPGVGRQDGSATLLFAPTWRRGNWSPSSMLGDVDALHAALDRSHTTMLVKAHLHSSFGDRIGDRIVPVPAHVDGTALLRLVDGVITDFSSIAFDAAALGTCVVWYPYEIDRYRRQDSPGFNVDYDTLTDGRAVSDPVELAEVITSGRWRNWTVPESFVNQLWGAAFERTLLSGNDSVVAAVRDRIRR